MSDKVKAAWDAIDDNTQQTLRKLGLQPSEQLSGTETAREAVARLLRNALGMTDALRFIRERMGEEPSEARDAAVIDAADAQLTKLGL